MAVIEITNNTVRTPKGLRVDLLTIKHVSKLRTFGTGRKRKYGFFVQLKAGEVPVTFTYEKEFDAYIAQSLLNREWKLTLKKNQRKKYS